MDLLLQAFYALVFPGILFVATVGLASTWAARMVSRALRRQADALPADDLDMRRAIAEIKTAGPGRVGLRTAVAMAGLGAAGAASMLLWQKAFGLGTGLADNIVVLMGLMAIPALVAFAISDWVARNKGLGANRDTLALVYGLILLLVLLVPAAGVGSPSLDRILQSQSASGPLLVSWPGSIAAVVGLLAARAVLSLYGTLWEEGVAAASGAAEALLIQLVRASWLYLIVAGLVLLFWAGPDRGIAGALLFWPKYILGVTALAALFEAMRGRPADVLAVGWVPLLVMAGGALALALWGF